jgi:hypothetical protein
MCWPTSRTPTPASSITGQTVTDIPEYVTVLSPYKAGLPYDFDQVRVFVWNLRKHRYETAFREHEIAGYLPVEVGMKKDPYQTTRRSDQTPLPSFTYRVLAANAPIPTPDPTTGLFSPGHLIVKTYRLEGNICRRLLRPRRPGPGAGPAALRRSQEQGQEEAQSCVEISSSATLPATCANKSWHLLCLLAAGLSTWPPQKPASLEDRLAAQNALFEDYYQTGLKESPEAATAYRRLPLQQQARRRVPRRHRPSPCRGP